MQQGPVHHSKHCSKGSRWILGKLPLLAAVSAAILSTGCSGGLADDGQAAAEWMVAQQRASGAVCMSGLLENGCLIEPYFVNRGLLGLIYNNISVAGSNQTQRGEILGMVQRWIEWYLDHLNQPDDCGVHGTVYDYKVVAGKEQSRGTYDSSDSYAATLLSLVAAFHDASGDVAAVRKWRDALELVLGAANATLRQNHLTNAKPNYPIAFTEDNVEVWAGLDDYARLSQSVGDARQASLVNASAALSRLAITEILWSKPSANWVVNEGAGTADWAKFYPDAQAQLWPALVRFQRATVADNSCHSLAERFVAAQGSAWSGLRVDSFPHTMLALPLVQCGQRDIAMKFLASARQKFFPQMRWPWHIAEAGGFVAAAQAVLSSAASVEP